jgi:hypothetical protein
MKFLQYCVRFFLINFDTIRYDICQEKFIECDIRENRRRMSDFIARRKCLSLFPQLLSDFGKICVHRCANNVVR